MTKLKNSLLNKFIQSNIPLNFTPKNKLLIAVSGGVDSMVLLNLCIKANLQMSVAHYNFLLRDSESEQDEHFVKTFCNENKIQCFINRFDTLIYCKENKLNIQDAARKLRYEWFNQILQENNLDYILTAHHQNDQVETVLINFFKGTGIAGLTGMDVQKNVLIRPLLSFSKSEIITFAQENNILFREDSSNRENKYLRNTLRLELIPQLEKTFIGFEKNILLNISRFQEIEQLYQKQIHQIKKKWFKYDGPNIKISIKACQQESQLTSIFFELFSPFGLQIKQINELKKLLNCSTGKYLQTHQFQFTIYGKHLIISPRTMGDFFNPIIIEQNTSHINLKDNKNLFFNLLNNLPSHYNAKNSQYVDYEKLEFPLTLRHWQEGDFFYPLGLNKKKKVKKFFNDKKIFLLDKQKIWILFSGEKVVALIGYCIDERFKITNESKKVLEIKFVNESI